MIDLHPPITLAEFMSYEYTAAIAEVDKSIASLRELWIGPQYEEISGQVILSLDDALDKRLDLMRRRDEWLK